MSLDGQSLEFDMSPEYGIFPGFALDIEPDQPEVQEDSAAAEPARLRYTDRVVGGPKVGPRSIDERAAAEIAPPLGAADNSSELDVQQASPVDAVAPRYRKGAYNISGLGTVDEVLSRLVCYAVAFTRASAPEGTWADVNEVTAQGMTKFRRTSFKDEETLSQLGGVELGAIAIKGVRKWLNYGSFESLYGEGSVERALRGEVPTREDVEATLETACTDDGQDDEVVYTLSKETDLASVLGAAALPDGMPDLDETPHEDVEMPLEGDLQLATYEQAAEWGYTFEPRRYNRLTGRYDIRKLDDATKAVILQRIQNALAALQLAISRQTGLDAGECGFAGFDEAYAMVTGQQIENGGYFAPGTLFGVDISWLDFNANHIQLTSKQLNEQYGRHALTYAFGLTNHEHQLQLPAKTPRQHYKAKITDAMLRDAGLAESTDDELVPRPMEPLTTPNVPADGDISEPALPRGDVLTNANVAAQDGMPPKRRRRSSDSRWINRGPSKQVRQAAIKNPTVADWML